jgi:hypothetical protein
MGIEAGVAGKPSSPQDGNGGGMKSRGGGGSGDRRMAWVSLEKAFEGGGASVRGVPRERKESEGGGGGRRRRGVPVQRGWVALSEMAACARSGGGLANKGERRGGATGHGRLTCGLR